MSLVERRVFPVPPERDVVDAFRRHVRETGMPETFPLVSTTRPPADGQILILHEPIGIPVKLRGDQAFASCPMCSPTKPKWKHGGALIWGEATSAIYCIGPDCSGNAWRDRLNVARNIFRQDRKAIRDAARLESLIAAAPALIEWIDHHLPLAADLSRRHASVRRELRQTRGIMARLLRPGFALARMNGQEHIVGRVAGVDFLRGTWTPDVDLRAARLILSTMLHDAGPKPSAWVDAMVPMVRHTRLLQTQKTIRSVEGSHRRMSSGAGFLTKENLETLARWTAMEGGPAGLSIVIAGAKAEIRYGEEFCRLNTGYPPPLPLPAHDEPSDEDSLSRIAA